MPLTPDSIVKKVKPSGHFIRNRRLEKVVGYGLFIIGAFLLYDAYDSRGKPMKWPFSSIFPW
jgi:hypothetical protein